jgi:hypothetical protein
MTTGTQALVLSIVRDFSRTPGPRRRTEGKYSGEEFLPILRDRYRQAVAQHARLVVDLDGAAGYATSFLEAAFGGLAREVGAQAALATLQFKSDDEPDLVAEIEQYIRDTEA